MQSIAMQSESEQDNIHAKKEILFKKPEKRILEKLKMLISKTWVDSVLESIRDLNFGLALQTLGVFTTDQKYTSIFFLPLIKILGTFLETSKLFH